MAVFWLVFSCRRCSRSHRTSLPLASIWPFLTARLWCAGVGSLGSPHPSDSRPRSWRPAACLPFLLNYCGPGRTAGPGRWASDAKAHGLHLLGPGAHLLLCCTAFPEWPGSHGGSEIPWERPGFTTGNTWLQTCLCH